MGEALVDLRQEPLPSASLGAVRVDPVEVLHPGNFTGSPRAAVAAAVVLLGVLAAFLWYSPADVGAVGISAGRPADPGPSLPAPPPVSAPAGPAVPVVVASGRSGRATPTLQVGGVVRAPARGAVPAPVVVAAPPAAARAGGQAAVPVMRGPGVVATAVTTPTEANQQGGSVLGNVGGGGDRNTPNR